VPRLSVTVITRDEQANLARALESVRWADEILVVDCGSTDDTVAIARRFGARVIVRDWPGYVEQKNHAADAAAHDWILSLDADERVSDALAAEIRSLLRAVPAAAGYRIPRVSYYLGRWIRTTSWYPDYQLRLYDRRRARWHGRHVHEGVRVEGEPGVLTCELEHYSYRDVSHHLEKMSLYAALAARGLHEQGRTATVGELVLAPALTFITNYVLRRGFRDGRVGFIVSALNSFYVFLKFARLWELQHASGGSRDDRERPSRLSA
jgi:glycosyltransferase involved in cell wall biosynthesis